MGSGSCPHRPQSEKATSWDPLEAGPLALSPFPKEVQGGGGYPPERGVPARRGVGVLARGALQFVRGQEAWEYHEPGTPHEPGRLVFSRSWRFEHVGSIPTTRLADCVR